MITIDHIVSALYSTIFNPWLALPLLTTYTYIHPDELTVAWRDSAHSYFFDITALSPFIRNSAYVILFGIALRAVNILNRLSLNNGVSDKYDWTKEVVVITGGAGGIGGDIVKQLSSKSTKVAVLDVLPLTYAKASNVEYFKCDLTDATSLAAAAKQIRAKWGNPTVLCCIAGIVRGKPLLELTKRDLDLTFGVNTVAVAMCYKEFLPAMVKANHGHVVTMASATAYMAAARMVDYAASKSAALALHEGLQTELKHIYKATKVRCTVLCPSVVATKMFTGLNSPSQFFNPILTSHEVAAAVVSALWAGEARHIELPWLSKVMMMPIKAAPSFWRVAIQDAASRSMSTFTGHKPMD